jgi:hypothetical protein
MNTDRTVRLSSALGWTGVVEVRHQPVHVADDGVVHDAVLRLIDVLDPLLVVVDAVDTQRHDLDAALRKLVLELGHRAQFRGAYGRKVLGVREEHDPVVANPLVKADRPLGRLRREIRYHVSKSDCHSRLPFYGKKRLTDGRFSLKQFTG